MHPHVSLHALSYRVGIPSLLMEGRRREDIGPGFDFDPEVGCGLLESFVLLGELIP